MSFTRSFPSPERVCDSRLAFEGQIFEHACPFPLKLSLKIKNSSSWISESFVSLGAMRGLRWRGGQGAALLPQKTSDCSVEAKEAGRISFSAIKTHFFKAVFT